MTRTISEAMRAERTERRREALHDIVCVVCAVIVLGCLGVGIAYEVVMSAANQAAGDVVREFGG